MKKIIYGFFLLCTAVLIYSCTKDDVGNKVDKDAVVRNSSCLGCDGIQDVIVTRLPGPNCIYHLDIIQKPGCSSYAKVYRGGTYMGFAYQVALQGGFNFYGLPTIIKIFSKDPVTGAQITCFYETYACKDCCDFSTITKEDLGATDGCCKTKITISNPSGSNCNEPLIVENANGVGVMTIPAGQTVSQTFTLCPVSPPQTYNVTINGGWVCKSFVIQDKCKAKEETE